MREHFITCNPSTYVFKPEYREEISAYELLGRMKSIWNHVNSHKDLNIPTYIEMLHHYRCLDVARAVKEYLASLISTDGRHTIVDKLGEMMMGWKERALEKFDVETIHFRAEVTSRIRGDLIDSIHDKLYPLFLCQIGNLRLKMLFWEVIKEAKGKHMSSFQDRAQEALVPQTNWKFEDEMGHLTDDIGEATKQFQLQEITKSVEHSHMNFRKEISNSIKLNLSTPSSKMCDDLKQVYGDELRKAERPFVEEAKCEYVNLYAHALYRPSMQQRGTKQRVRVSADQGMENLYQ